MIGATIPEKWTVSPIGYENANAVPKRRSAAGNVQQLVDIYGIMSRQEECDPELAD